MTIAMNDELQALLARDSRRVIILDDDPTGTQTVSEVSVILKPALAAYRAFFQGRERAVFVLTNTRAMPETEARALVRTVRAEVNLAAREAGETAAFLLRGDSTLRGHIFEEIDELADGDAVSLFVPAFPEGGRKTKGGVHYLRLGEADVPVAQTEFAQDPVFGYASATMAEWAAERGGGRKAVLVPLLELREKGSQAVARRLLEAPAGSVVIPDAEKVDDIRIIAAGLLQAEAQGKRIVVRSASTLAAIRAGLEGRAARPVTAAEKLLVVCGSHTAATTRQLQLLADRHGPAIVLPTDRIIGGDREAAALEAAEQLRSGLAERGIAILASERVRRVEHGDLASGSAVMDMLTQIVSRLRGEFDAIVCKGGITSAQMATDGIGVGQARVIGQLEPGVSLWELRQENGCVMPYAVIPGNVGHNRTMLDVVASFQAPTESATGG